MPGSLGCLVFRRQGLNFDATIPRIEEKSVPYCRRCGAKLEEDWRFCQNCGTQVINNFTPPPAPDTPAAPLRPMRKDPILWTGVALAAILVAAAVIAAILAAPVGTWSLAVPYGDSSPNVHTLNLNFQADIAKINILTEKNGNDNILVYVSGNGSRGLTGGSAAPLNVTFVNQTMGDVLTVDMEVTVEQPVPLANVVCDIYVDPNLKLNLNVTTTTGQITFGAEQPTTIETLRLQATTGQVEANLHSDTTVAGNLTLKTTTGAVYFSMSETKVVGNCTLDLHSTTGAVNMDISETKTLQGNLAVEADTNTGAINVNLIVDSGVGAKINSQVNGFGNIHADLTHFNGDKSPLQSDNYPAASNIEITNHVNGFGDVNIDAVYQTQLATS